MKARKQLHAVNAGSMADIAFLLLIFFMITTTIKNDKGITMLLPPHIDDRPIAEISERNIFKILINSNDNLLIEDVARKNPAGLRNEIKKFVLNYGHDPALSENPKKAVVSIKSARGTSHGMFIKILDEAKAAYYEIYAERVGITPTAYRNLANNIKDQSIFGNGKKDIPMNISIAESN